MPVVGNWIDGSENEPTNGPAALDARRQVVVPGGPDGTNGLLPLRIATRDGKWRTDDRECLPLQGLPATDRRGYALWRILQQIPSPHRRSRENLYAGR